MTWNQRHFGKGANHNENDPVNDSTGNYQWAIVNDEHFKSLREFNWTVKYQGNNVYVSRKGPEDYIYLHAAVYALQHNNAPVPEGYVIDHINRCGLDNRWKHNLRLATVAQNSRNSGPRFNEKSGLYGVPPGPTPGTYRLTLYVNGEQVVNRVVNSIEEFLKL